ncbi:MULTISPECIES: polysaccharide deacetylase family protein [Lacticaseibacillus]|uniref:Deacetylase n=2 Tax=Lacticaseibacillus TaxID=2759736 RepID=A0AAN1KEJ2_LACCA|nr:MULTISPECIES: polysaccharide deacetylase family protein [Lacticaseibacillus]ARY91958.1 deacetylase [Lacticaseibacillus casei]KAB1971004.1 polysaccharide deacetylase [Lacticaseibacillus casei]WLV79859.1 polysaccharide deacetylase family protein [Lacticaseibacillus sp. NCIMB 15473]WNX23819.1 polysaccharide deacetylase family protein [Lacticaseibacillus casei]WNX26594.1 polysaccharide deacetylase family protein [Lacticaseibacillus casei]
MKSSFKWQWWLVVLGLTLIVAGALSVKSLVDRHAAEARARQASHERAVADSISTSKAQASSRRASSSKKRKAAEQAEREQASAELPSNIGQAHIPAATAYAYPVAEVKKEMTAPYTSNIKKKVVFLTFDDGPNTVNSPQVLNILNQAGVHGTFFVVGRQLSPETAPVLKAEYDAGNSIGLHSMTHNYNLLYPGRTGAASVIENEAKTEQAAVKQVLGADFETHLWRYPGGHFSWKGLATADTGLTRLGLDWVDWNAAVGDALSPAQEPKTEDAMLQYHLRSLAVYPTSNVRVVLMHDAIGKDMTVKTLPKIIDYYRSNGYEFGVLS